MPVSRMSERFAELLMQAEAIEQTKTTKRNTLTDKTYEIVDSGVLLGWQVKCRTLLVKACGADSEHYQQFCKTEKPGAYRDSWTILQQLKSIMLAAQEDYDGGYLDEIRTLVQAEVFSDELEQARELLSAGYRSPAAVVAGVILETKLRDMCGLRKIELGKLERMNADLTKAGAYTSLVQKRVTAIAGIRNSAAHGRSSDFNDADVADMITYIERFISDHH